MLREITDLFEQPDTSLQLDPEFESEPDPDGEDDPDRAGKRETGRKLKRLRDARLVESVDGEDLYWTAMDSKAVQLTALGRYYWRLVDEERI